MFTFLLEFNTILGQQQIDRDKSSRGMEKITSPLVLALAGCSLPFKPTYLPHFK